jgi:membrane associated rhomboid family serine protease
MMYFILSLFLSYGMIFFTSFYPFVGIYLSPFLNTFRSMNTGRKRSALSYIPGYANNAVLQLILFSAVAYVALSLIWAVMMLVYQGDANFNQYFIPNLALPLAGSFKSAWWTIATYGWFQYPHGFWEMLSNMVWLYCFGSVVQMLVGHKQVIPLYIYSLLIGGAVYMLAQLLPGELGKCPPYLLGPRAALVSMAAAAVTLTPKYRFYLTDTFSIPLLAMAGIFIALMLLGSGFYLPIIIMLLAGGLTGFGYIRLLQAGYRPGEWMYDVTARIAGAVTPDENAGWPKKGGKRDDFLSRRYEPKTGISQKRIDEILDKINQKGYNSLSSEEKDTLMRAGKE